MQVALVTTRSWNVRGSRKSQNKIAEALYFGGSRSFKVTDDDTPGKLVSSAVAVLACNI